MDVGHPKFSHMLKKTLKKLILALIDDFIASKPNLFNLNTKFDLCFIFFYDGVQKIKKHRLFEKKSSGFVFLIDRNIFYLARHHVYPTPSSEDNNFLYPFSYLTK